jgi:hypothetical protein
MKGNVKVSLILTAVMILIYVQPFTRIYAAGDINTTKDYVFYSEYEDDIKISLDYKNIKNESNEIITKDNIIKLESFITYTKDSITFAGTEAFSFNDLISGRANISIDYKLKGLFNSSTYQLNDIYQKRPLYHIADTFSDSDEMYLGVIPFTLDVDNLYWRISNQNGSWGIGVPNLGTPSIINKLLPNELVNLHGYNRFVYNENGNIVANLMIEKESPVTDLEDIQLRELGLRELEIRKLKLSELELPQEINELLTANETRTSKLEVVTTYKFDIPFSTKNNNKTKSNVENDKCINGTITLRILLDVVH